MRRLALLFIGGAVWLFLAAIPVFADGGPHMMSVNNGSSGINADSCAGCHRVHSAKSKAGSPAGMLLANPAATVSDFCLTCHGKVGAGATTDVQTGLQYYLADLTQNKTSGTILGALRGGGFESARIASDKATRKLTFAGVGAEPGIANAKIPVRTDATTVTSAHLEITGVTLQTTGTAWGNGAVNSGAGPTVNGGALECTSCHNPHGNGQYRILNPIPGDGSGGMTEVTSGTSVPVFDETTFTGTATRNYSVITVEGTFGSPSTFLLTADQVMKARSDGTFNGKGTTGDFGPLSGDYFHKFSQYNTANTSSRTPPFAFDAPNASDQFTRQMAAWCSACHTRYYVTGGGRTTALSDGTTIDSIFTYRHTSAGATRACTTCHVAHGSNAMMDGTGGTTYSRDLRDPSVFDPNLGRLTGAIRSGDSRLLKVDNRGTCQLCHEPTNGSSFPTSATTGDTQVQGTPPQYFP